MTCPCGSPARHWAVDKSRTDLLPSVMGPYCLDLNAYTAMCVPCHKVMDLRSPCTATATPDLEVCT